MNKRIAAKPPSAPPSQPSGLSSTGGMPREIVGQACKRLAALAIPIGLLALAGFILNWIGPSTFGWSVPCSRWGMIFNGAIVILSAGMLPLIGRYHDDTAKLVTIGYIYWIAVSFAVSYAELQGPAPAGRLIGGVSLVTVFIVLFPMLIPSSLKRTILVALVAASTGPLAALLYSQTGGSAVPLTATALSGYVPNYLVVGLVAFPVALFQRMGREVARAQKLGSYELQEKLGFGGMGEVWRGEHQLLRRPAAVKLISGGKLSASEPALAETRVRRFEREAQATAELKSPHTIQLYDYGVTEDGTLYYVMELLDGFDLEELVSRFGPMPAARAVHLLRQMCDSLWDAHQSGLVHRDVKPANVYICQYGHRSDYVKVLDFGLVKDTSRTARDAKLTHAGAVTGTPAFMAPEMAQGEAYDARADLYAVGCVAYWMVTGQLVFERPSAMKTLLAHVNDAPVPPSRRTELAIPPELDRIVLKCLAKDPADRYQTARELDEDLERFARKSDSWSEAQADRWWQTHEPLRRTTVSLDPVDALPATTEAPRRLAPAPH